MKTLRISLVMGLLALLVVPLGSAPTVGQETFRFTCRASVLRVTIVPLNVTVEPFVANPQNDPCRTALAGVLNEAELPFGLGEASVLFARTDEEGRAEAGVVDLVMTVPGAPRIEAEVLPHAPRAHARAPGRTPH